MPMLNISISLKDYINYRPLALTIEEISKFALGEGFAAVDPHVKTRLPPRPSMAPRSGGLHHEPSRPNQSAISSCSLKSQIFRGTTSKHGTCDLSWRGQRSSQRLYARECDSFRSPRPHSDIKQDRWHVNGACLGVQSRLSVDRRLLCSVMVKHRGTLHRPGVAGEDQN